MSFRNERFFELTFHELLLVSSTNAANYFPAARKNENQSSRTKI